MTYKKDYIGPILLTFPIIMLPLEGFFPFTIAGLSVTALSVIPLALYTLFTRTKLFLRNFTHPCVLTGLLIFGFEFVSEIFHDNSSYSELIRNAQNLVFAVIVATLITDTRPIRIVLTAWITISTILGFYFILTLFARVSIPVENYAEATFLRYEVLERVRLGFDWNTVGYLVGIGAVAALGMLLEKPNAQHIRLLLMFSAVCCVIGSAVILYRGPVLMILLAGGTMLIVRAKKIPRRTPIFIVIFILAMSSIFIPPALPKRFEIELQPGDSEQYMDPRVKIYSRAIALMPQYFLTGVGRGGYYELWGPKNGFIHNFMADRGLERAPGLHNAFLQNFVFYGVAALLLLCLLAYRARRCLYAVRQDFPFFVTMRGLAMSGLVIMLLSHMLYAKELGLILGMLIAAERLGKRCASS